MALGRWLSLLLSLTAQIKKLTQCEQDPKMASPGCGILECLHQYIRSLNHSWKCRLHRAKPFSTKESKAFPHINLSHRLCRRTIPVCTDLRTIWSKIRNDYWLWIACYIHVCLSRSTKLGGTVDIPFLRWTWLHRCHVCIWWYHCRHRARTRYQRNDQLLVYGDDNSGTFGRFDVLDSCEQQVAGSMGNQRLGQWRRHSAGLLRYSITTGNTPRCQDHELEFVIFGFSRAAEAAQSDGPHPATPSHDHL